jgi:O-antigen/teichoic acid export membrane protein
MALQKKEDDIYKKRILKNMLFGSITGLSSKFGALIFTVIVARVLLPELFGIYSLALTIILTASMLTDFGIGSTLTRFISESIGKNKIIEARSRFWYLLKIKLTTSVIIITLLFLFADLISTFFQKPELAPLLKIGSIYLFLVTIEGFTTNIFLSFQEIKYSTYAEIITQISKIILLYILLLFSDSIIGVFVVLTISLLISLLYTIYIVKRRYSKIIFGKRIAVERKRMIQFSTYLTFSVLTVALFSNIDKLMLGYYIDAEFIGYYAAIVTVIAGVVGIVGGFGGILFPVFTQLKEERLNNAFKKTFHYYSLITIPSSIGLSFIMVPLLKILYGFDYVPKEYELSIMITSIFLSLLVIEAMLSSLYKILLNSKEKPKIPALITFYSTTCNIILNIILISILIKINPVYGLIGASIATFTSRYSALLLFALLTKKHTKITPNKQSMVKPLFASIIMLLYLFIYNNFIKLNIITGIIMIISAAIIYFIIIILLKAIDLREIKELIFKKASNKVI